nr:hypothetical protein [Tanacetum cinerariifolium]
MSDLGNEVRSSVEERMTTLEDMNERVERDLYWIRVRAYGFYQEMIRRGVVFEDRPSEAIDVLVKDEESPSFAPRGSPRDSKWENFQSGNSSRNNYKDNYRHQQNNQKQGNTRAMTTALNEGNVPTGPLPVCDHCFVRHIGHCTIQCHKCGNVRHKARYCKEKIVATGANAYPIWTCYDCDDQGHKGTTS